MLLPRESQHDFYSIAAGDDIPTEESLGRSELWAEAVFILPAGGTTMSSALSAVFFYLSRYPEVYARLAAEIRTTFESGTDIHAGPQLSGCKYLRAVVDETLRIAPPFVGTFWREHDSFTTDPLIVDGHSIPRGTIVGVNPYCLMHNEEYFPHAFEFRPQRWLEPEDGKQESPEEENSRIAARRAFAPFALGETGCLGKGMAYHETSLTLAKTMWYFDFEYPLNEAGKMGEGQPGRTDGRHRKEEYQLYDISTAGHEGPTLMFKPREEYWKEL
ncbi:hypothetical protein N0V82_010875 [Gnomoniopsis sp. IMI 355080]|nr:hypothetical protein N0V82_010875 [Gnomoniopsis sp. IMI 355080]